MTTAIVSYVPTYSASFASDRFAGSGGLSTTPA
jgi:hypothetical protein